MNLQTPVENAKNLIAIRITAKIIIAIRIATKILIAIRITAKILIAIGIAAHGIPENNAPYLQSI